MTKHDVERGLKGILHAHPEPNVRLAAGRELIRKYIKGEYADQYLKELFEDQEAPEDVRHLAGMELVEAEAEKGYYHPLEELSENEKVSNDIRSGAGRKVVENLSSERDLYRLLRSQLNRKLPEDVRALAKECIERLEIEIVETYSGRGLKCYEATGFGLLAWPSDRETHFIFTSEGLEVDFYGPCGDLLELSKDKAVPDEIRSLAGMKAISIYFYYRNGFGLLGKLYQDTTLPEDVRQRAKGTIREAIEQTNGSYDGGAKFLTKLLKNDSIPDDLRSLAGWKIVTTCVTSGYYDDIIKISENERVPEDTRSLARENIRRAGMTAIENRVNSYFEGNFVSYLDDLKKIFQDERLPEDVRSSAKEKMVGIAQDLANELLSRPIDTEDNTQVEVQ